MTSIRDFEHPEASMAGVSAAMFAGMMARTADIALLLDAGGMVRDVAFGMSDLANAGLGRLVGEPLIDLVTTESRGKIEALLAGSSPASRWRHVNLPVPNGDDVPISLQAFGLGGGRALVVGRDERQGAAVQRRFIDAARELDRAQARQRQADLRFRTMLTLSDLAVLTIDGDTLQMLDISPSAQAILGDASAGQSFVGLFERAEAEPVRDALVRLMASGRIADFAATLRRHAAPIAMQAALFRHEGERRILVRLLDADAAVPDRTGDMFAGLPHGLVIADARLQIESANRAFADLAQLSLVENAVGQPLDRFLGRGGVDTGILIAALREEPLVRGFASLVTGSHGAVSDVEVDAVRLAGDHYGFLFRLGGPDRRARALEMQDRAGLAGRVTDVVGRVALKDIVRDTTDVIERLCIQTALELTDNNRAAAAEMLGISRQSLYGKLARYGIGHADAGDQTAD